MPVAQKRPSEEPKPSLGNSDALAERHIVRLYSRMQHLFGHKWMSAYGDAMGVSELTSSAKHWYYDLREFTPAQVAQGLMRVEQLAPEWPPSPMEFKKLCMGVPTIEEVIDRKNDYGPICGEIRKRLDWYNLESMPTKQMRDQALAQYRQAITSMSRSGQLHRLALTASSWMEAIE